MEKLLCSLDGKILGFSHYVGNKEIMTMFETRWTQYDNAALMNFISKTLRSSEDCHGSFSWVHLVVAK